MTVEQNEFLSSVQLQILAEQAIKQYPNEYQGSVKLLCQSENATFLVTTAQAKYALRIHRPNYHHLQDIESELAWLDALNQSGIEVPLAIADQDGQRVITLKLAEGISRYAVLFNWINGSMPTTDVDPTAFQQLGQITAALHQHSKSWKRPEQFNRIVWNHDTMVGAQGHWGNWKHAPYLDQADHAVVEEAIARISTELCQYGADEDRYGLIHADLRLTNLLLQDQQIGVIDFDDCGMSWFMHDLAAAISFNEHLDAAPQWVEYWLTGYEKTGHVQNHDYVMIPTFIMQRRIQMMAWNGSHAHTEMALSLGDQWSNETVRLCKKYLNGEMPVGRSNA